MGLISVIFFLDSALCCRQCFQTLWKFVTIREVGHRLPQVVVQKERSCASPSLIRLRGVSRDRFNTIQIGIVTD